MDTQYLVNSGKVDDMSPTFLQDVKKYRRPHRRICRNPVKKCTGEMYFSGTVTLRPGRPDEKDVAVYTCFRCGYAIMEEI